MSSAERRLAVRASVALCSAMLLTAACGGAADDHRAPATSAGSAPHNADSLRAAATGESVAKARDEWNPAEVTKRLTEAGLVVVDAKHRVTRNGIGGQGALLRVSGSDLEVYLYPSAAERRRQTAGLDTAASPFPPGSPLRPRYVIAGNLIAVLLTARDELEERVENALMARHGGGD